MDTVVFLSGGGTNTAPGTFQAPRRDLDGFKFPDKGELLILVEAFHVIGDVTAPPGLKTLIISAYRARNSKEQLPRLKAPWPTNTWPTVGRITSTCPTHLRHLKTGDVDITVTGTEKELAGVTLQHVKTNGDLNLSGCQYPCAVPQHVTVTGKTTVARNKGGVIHFQHWESDEFDVTDAAGRIIAGSTHVYPGGKRCDPVDCCKYRVKLGMPWYTATMMLYGTGKAEGLLESAKGKKPEWQKG